ncbi:Pr6Pr family membrane protein [Micrococcus sp.]|uniref:Pr6Pr family membrane protein n=1 Tax=Micrococcus sp. TaxID=1271 RepID=UPI002A90B6C8|nr:Pr6Pr family membrane protein [Micrococcus sp.]MDY6055049.1 Pr6Pr family membrane protein [Micrococcus sp.]
MPAIPSLRAALGTRALGAARTAAVARVAEAAGVVVRGRRPRRTEPAPGTLARTGWWVAGTLPLLGCLTSFPIGASKPTLVIPGVGYQGGFTAGWQHALNQPAYFTWVSNALVAATSLTLAARRTAPTSDAFWAARTAGLGSVMVTGIVYNAALRGMEQNTLLYRANDAVQHVVNPVLAPAVWALADPRGQITARRAGLAAVLPLLWTAATLVRGARIDWYPYPFLDVPKLGYRGVGAALSVVLMGFTGLLGVLGAVDRRLGQG